jgi:hypothetical protein
VSKKDLEQGASAVGVLEAEAEIAEESESKGSTGSPSERELQEAASDLEDEIRRTAEELVTRLDSGRKKVKKTERRDLKRDERRRTMMTVASVVLSLACVALTAMNLTATGPFARRAPALSESQVRQLVAGDLLFAVQEIEAVVEDTGEVPIDISSFDFASEPGWSYARIGKDVFLLSLSDDGFRASYDSRLGSKKIDVQRTK